MTTPDPSPSLNDSVRNSESLRHSAQLDKPITVSFRWTSDEFLRVEELKMWYPKRNRKFRWAVLSGGTLALICGVVFLSRGGAFVVPGGPLATIGIVTMLIPFSSPRRPLATYEQQPDHNRVVTYEISANLIALRSDVTSSESLLRGIIQAYRTPKGFLLYQTDREVHWLPVSGFQDSADIERLAEILKSKVRKYNDVR